MSLASGNPPRLLDQVREVIRMRHYSIRTEDTYLEWIRRYIRFHGRRHPRDLDSTHIAAFPVAVNLDCHSHRTSSVEL